MNTNRFEEGGKLHFFHHSCERFAPGENHESMYGVFETGLRESVSDKLCTQCWQSAT